MRVVSVLPSATELLYALGVEPIGVSHECDYPPAAADRPTVISTRIDAAASSAEIDDQVTAAEQEGGVYEIDRDLLADLDPDVVVSQGTCEVCAVDDSVIRRAVEELGLGAEVVTTDPHTLDGVFDDIERLGAVLDRSQRAGSLVMDLRKRVEAIADATPADGPRVAVLDWLDPVMIAGHWIPGMVGRAGGQYGLADPGERSRPREWAEIRSYDPEVIIAAPCGFEIEQTLENTGDLTDQEGWEDLSAVRQGRVYAMDGHHYVNRPGPRLVETLELVAGLLHPDAVEPATTGRPGPAVVEWPSIDRAGTRERAAGSR